MLTNEDIQKLLSVFKTVFPTKEEVADKEDLEKLNSKFEIMMNSLDAYAKKADAYFQEMVMFRSPVTLHA